MDRYYNHIVCLLIILMSISCTSEKSENLFELLTPNYTGVSHLNTIKSTPELNVFKYRNFYNGGGVSIGDVNNDGLPDLYFTINRGENKLYLNKGNLTFEDVTQISGVSGTKPWSTGVVMVDINHDGWLDIYVCNAGIDKGSQQDNELFINQQDGSFKDQALEYNLADSGITTHAAFFDYDNDGDLDVYLLNNSFIPVTSLGYNDKRELRDKDWKVSEALKGGGDRLLKNENGVFVDVSEQAGIYGSLIGFGLGVTLGDINNDGYIDIYVSNDFYERDYLYVNQQDGTFKENIENMFNHLSHASMGADMADLNNDGYLEVFVTDMLPEDDQRLKETTEYESFNIHKLMQEKGFYDQFMQNTLQVNNKNNTFSELSYFAGVAATDWSWGALLFDMDSDGYKDIFVCNGIYHELTNQDFLNFFANDVIQEMKRTGKKEIAANIIKKMPSRPITNYVFKNNQDLTFDDTTVDWGFDQPTFSNGSAYGDLDLDGDLDLVINNVNQPAMIYENKAVDRGANFIKIKLHGTGENTFGIGSKIIVFSNGEVFHNELIPSKGFQSSVDYSIVVGLGDKKAIDSIAVIWPNQLNQTKKNVVVNTTVQFNEDEATGSPQTRDWFIDEKQTVLSLKKNTFEPHKEDNYVDYNLEPLVTKMLSREGPALAVADVDQNGLDDVYLGNAFDSKAQLLLQVAPGEFVSKTSNFLENSKDFEDTAAAFFDADNDGDQDLFVGSGGNHIAKNKTNLQDRLYLNDGKGNFIRSLAAIPFYQSNTSIVAPYDMDSDGDIDLFIGNRSVSAIYGIDPSSVFLENDGKGNYKDVTSLKAYDLNKVGMITDAKWVELTGDERKDLVVVGDWMSPKIFQNTGVSLEEIPSSLNDLLGWWNTILVGDFNNDERQDFILGNKGTNSSYIGSKESNAKIYINDFDENGTLDQIHTREIDGKDYPINLRNELIDQIPSIKNANINFSDYATKDITDLFEESGLKGTIIKIVNESKSVVAINTGNQNFQVHALPNQIQWNSVNSGIVDDFNKDGKLDLLLGGGEDHLKPQFAKQDAGYGEMLYGNGKGNFEWVPYEISGLKVKGMVRGVEKIRMGTRSGYIFGINNNNPVFYEQN